MLGGQGKWPGKLDNSDMTEWTARTWWLWMMPCGKNIDGQFRGKKEGNWPYQRNQSSFYLPSYQKKGGKERKLTTTRENRRQWQRAETMPTGGTEGWSTEHWVVRAAFNKETGKNKNVHNEIQ